jgi:hypothetical protein
MPTKDLLAAVDRLVEVATHDGDDRALRSAVNGVVRVFDAADARKTSTAIDRIAAGVRRSDGRAAQVLHLTLGALVEGGASPELAWPAIVEGLETLLHQASRFADACLERARDAAIDEALASAAMEVAERRPRDAAAWRETPSRCLAAVACLTRSRTLRKNVRGDTALVEATIPLAEAIDEVGLLLQLLRMLDDEPFVVIHAEEKRGFRIVLRDVASNAELLVLLAGPLFGKKTNTKLAAALAKGKSVSLETSLAFDTTVRGDLIDGVPADFPERNGAHVIVLHSVPARALAIDPSFVGLTPTIDVVGKATDIARWLPNARPKRAKR